jgi:hypothetical protein
MTMPDVTLDLDSRRRVSLGSLFDENVTHLIAHRFEDGSVMLEPASVVSKLEQRFHSNPVAVEEARQAATSQTAKKIDIEARRAKRRGAVTGG